MLQPPPDAAKEINTYFLKICAWLHALPLHQNHMYTYLFEAVSENYLRAIWKTISWIGLWTVFYPVHIHITKYRH